MEDDQVREQVAAAEGLLQRLDELPDEDSRARASDAVAALLGLYGEALRRILDQVSLSPDITAGLAGDELVSHLLLLHNLHPDTVEERVERALEEVRPYLGSHGGGVELLEVADGVARVRLEGTCNGCQSSTVTLKLAIEDAVLEAAPELRAVEAAGELEVPSTGTPLPMAPTASTPAASTGGLPEGILNGAVPGPTAWADAGELSQLAGVSGPLRRDVEGAALLFAGVEGELYAYADRCPGCRTPLEDPELDGDELRCGGCGRRYDVRGAGQCLDGPLLQLDPVPLLVEGPGRVKVAVGAVLV